ncbi:hypothetical protein DPMN_120341 [Dreissena polymorpha]|uniref:Uncharacterized protein n=1 Tax=Dreissena polymorpha TaxID=45954 RepID=A0A9D4GK10_DREPO|nr:hypothetical protein DPMN_120341 [Dreissena polymorpha]
MTDRQTNRKHRLAGRQAGSQTDRQTDRQTDGQTKNNKTANHSIWGHKNMFIHDYIRVSFEKRIMMTAMTYY